MRAVFAMSLRHVPAAQKDLLRALASVPAQRFDAYLAAAAAGISVATARGELDGLVDAHLLQEPQAEVYTFHDLVAGFARRLAAQQDDQSTLAGRTDRVLSYYRSCLLAVSRELGLPDRPLAQAPEPLAADLPDLTGSRAVAWLDCHRDSIVLAVRAPQGDDLRVCALAQGLTAFMHSYTGGGTVRERMESDMAGLAAAERAGHLGAQAWLTGDLGLAHYDCGMLDVAFDYVSAAITLAEQAEDLHAQAMWHALTCSLYQHAGQPAKGIEPMRRALALYQQIGEEYGIIRMSGHLGNALVNAGYVDEGIPKLEAALTAVRSLGVRHGILAQAANLGYAYLAAGRYDDALECLRETLPLARGNRDLFMEAFALNGLAEVHCHFGDQEQALALHNEAIDLVSAIGDSSQREKFLADFRQAAIDSR
jgi:tetratricopeptide (TPR) repeat protein